MAKFSFFGSTIKETIEALRKPDDIFNIPPLPPTVVLSNKNRWVTEKSSPPLPTLKARKVKDSDIFETRLKAIMRIVVTLILLGISVFLLLQKTTESKTLPCSIISAVTGYWLK